MTPALTYPDTEPTNKFVAETTRTKRVPAVTAALSPFKFPLAMSPRFIGAERGESASNVLAIGVKIFVAGAAEAYN
ncbi:hypothetical protein EV213_106209 [Aureibacillus halotolerans]|uniref:Uncharacterized protein n=1 Tax=Aureibacillus halotolerans TaxID=1508390 RepID=A0A4R6U2C2_9BACI|nr:hypothetical protein EV213_106209 [Aureibacillus halotolerans]